MGILRTAGRAAVASSVHGRVQRRQRERWAQADAPAPSPPSAPAPPSPPPPTPVPATGPAPDLGAQLAQLAQLGELRAAGILTDAEFEAKKALIMGG